jgi:membrane-associated phospholipid phosphatase
VRSVTLAGADLALLRLARTRGHPPAVERAISRFSALGEHAGLWLALGAAGAAVDRGRRARWMRAAAAVAGAYLLNTALKLVIRRRRPHLPGLPPLVTTPTELSFPSAHATSSFTAARVYAPLVPPAARMPLRGLAAAMAASRLYVGVHYPSDILAGAALGVLVGGLSR